MTDASQPHQDHDLTALGSYDLESRLGQGGMGIVYLATDNTLHRQVAIKVLHPQLLQHENLKDRFRREARMHAKLMHPNIVTLLSLYEDEEHMALVMELVEGEDLKAYLRHNPQLPLQEKLDIAVHILTGLEAAHKFGMVHRDLKPANILISHQHEVKLMDFGLAKPEHSDDDLTQSGATVGSFRYMSPEQILNQPIDARTDLYAFGILMFQMTTGELPFDATSNGGEFEIMEKQVRDKPTTPHHINPEIPKALSKLILSLLEKQKNDRPKDADSVRHSIRHIREQLGDSKIVSPPSTISKDSSLISNYAAQPWFEAGFARLQTVLGRISPALAQPKAAIASTAIMLLLLISAAMALFSPQQPAPETAQATSPTVTKAVSKIAAKEAVPAAPIEVKPMAAKTVATAEKTVASYAEPVSTKPTHTAKEAAPETKVAVVEEVKVKPKPKPKPKKKKRRIRSVTYNVKHQVTRSDDSPVNSKKRHEFRGGKHLFYPGLEEKSWFTSFKRGESKVEFDKPVRISTIVLRKASVGRLNFKKGYIYLEIQDVDGDWTRLFERKDDDVDVKVTIRKVYKHVAKIKAVRIKFKTPEPITIGPIDLLP